MPNENENETNENPTNQTEGTTMSADANEIEHETTTSDGHPHGDRQQQHAARHEKALEDTDGMKPTSCRSFWR